MDIKNTTASNGTWVGQLIAAGATYTIQDIEFSRWGVDQQVLADILAGNLEVYNPSALDPVTGLAAIRQETPRPVRTQRELQGMRLQAATMEGTADGTGLIVASIQVPATGISAGRFIDWGEAWLTGSSHDDDRILSIRVVDTDDLLGFGAGTVLSSYTDEDSANGGWWIPAKPALAEVEPLGWYGLIPGGMYLEIRAQCGDGASGAGRKLRVNLGWGKDE